MSQHCTQACVKSQGEGVKRILIACEFSGTVRDAFAAKGWFAMSCDLLPTESPGEHYQGDVLDVLYDKWDALIAHPPCTYLSSSGLHWNKRRPERALLTDDAIAFAKLFIEGCSHIPRVAVENPIGCLSTRVRKPDQIIHPSIHISLDTTRARPRVFGCEGCPCCAPLPAFCRALSVCVHARESD